MQHDPHKLEDEAHNLNDLIEQSNGKKVCRMSTFQIHVFKYKFKNK